MAKSSRSTVTTVSSASVSRLRDHLTASRNPAANDTQSFTVSPITVTSRSLVRAPQERWQHGNEAEPVTRRTARDQPQRVRTALAALQSSGRADGAQLAAAARWTRDYELGVHLARDPESIGTGSGSPDGIPVAACDALSRHRETSVSLGRAGTELMVLVGHRGLSLSAVARYLNPSHVGNNVTSATQSILAALDVLVEHYEAIDTRSSRQRRPWAERVASHLRAVPGPKRTPTDAYAA